MTPCSLSDLSDDALLARTRQLAARERQATADLIASLVELDARRLYLGEGCASLFTYCTQILHLSEHAAYERIAAARAARRFPSILARLVEGSVNLTAVTLLAPHLTMENHDQVLEAACHKSKRDVEHLVAHLRPQPDVPSSIRRLSPPTTSAVASDLPAVDTARDQAQAAPTRGIPPAPRPDVIRPLAPERYKVQFTVSRETYDKLRRAQDLLRHSIPNGDAAAIFDRALTLLLHELARTKLASTARPRTARSTSAGSRHICPAVKREVWARDGGRCAFVGVHGRCTETGFLEFHHVQPYAAGGVGTAENVALRCRAHNAHEAEQYFGSRPPLLVREHPRTSYWADARSVRTELPHEQCRAHRRHPPLARISCTSI